MTPNIIEIRHAADDSIDVEIRDLKEYPPQAFGIMLADAAQHIANMLRVTRGLNQTESLALIVQSFRRETRATTTFTDPVDA